MTQHERNGRREPPAGEGDEGEAYDDFLSAVRDVAPLANDRAPPQGGPRAATDAQKARRHAAEHDTRIDDPNYLNFRVPHPVAPEEFVEFYKDGVQHGVRKKLRLGEYPIQDALDLHRRTLAEARHELYWFLQRSLARELRLVLVSHGKGLNSETPGRLKTHVAHWLRQVPEVVAYSSAQRMHGGTGAVYVLLRKGEFERMENRERHGHKGRLDHTR